MKQKLKGRSVLVGVDHIFEPEIQIWKDLGPMCFLSHFQAKFIKTKTLGLTYLATFALTIHFIILI
jgi:hypothetical protein